MFISQTSVELKRVTLMTLLTNNHSCSGHVVPFVDLMFREQSLFMPLFSTLLRNCYALKRCSVRLYPQLLVGELLYLRYLCLFVTV